jgi:hypothetical protein
MLYALFGSCSNNKTDHEDEREGLEIIEGLEGEGL